MATNDHDQNQSDLSRREFLRGTGAVAAASFLGSQGLGQVLRDDRIVKAAIYPGIGIARVGNSLDPNGFFIGPEVIDPEHTSAKLMRDSEGALKRQAARFRVFGLNKDGQPVRELTPKEAKIEWTVTLANKKPAWYRFTSALDIKESAGVKNIRRNQDVKGEARQNLVIKGGTRSISGPKESGKRYHFDEGNFMGTPVYLGELRTDEQGRLLVLGGLGKAGSPENKPIFIPEIEDSFNNADGWWDDISDGTVDAKVIFNGEELKEVEGAWIAVAPPNYAPDVIGWRTMYDLLVDLYVDKKMLPAPKTTSFTQDVLPYLQRLSGLQWVNQGISNQFARGMEFDFDDPKVVARLANPAEQDYHRKIYLNFRLPGSNASPSQKLWPRFYGDSFGSSPADEPNNAFFIHSQAALHLKNWADGNYVNDWRRNRPRLRRLSQVDPKDQADMLNRAALHYCLADAFHPGCELTWPMRHIDLYRAPFRIKRRTAAGPAVDPGELLTPTNALAKDPGAPLQGQEPGDLTKWMAIPWHGDTTFCRAGYEPEVDPYLPTFWPARVPNHVLTDVAYRLVTKVKENETSEERAERLATFRNRAHWLRTFRGKPDAQMLQMLTDFSKIGIVEARPGITGDAEFPPLMFVEALAENAPVESVPFASKGVPNKIEQAGWEDEETLKAFRKARGVRPRGTN